MFKFAANLSLLFQEYAFLDEAPAEDAAAKGYLQPHPEGAGLEKQALESIYSQGLAAESEWCSEPKVCVRRNIMPHESCVCVDGFPAWQKLAMRSLFLAVLVVGAVAVFRHSLVWGWIYLAWASLGQLVFIVPNLCAHCPYPYKYNDCLLAPAGLMRLFTYKGPEISRHGRFALAAGGAGLVLIPQYWLFQDPILLLVFWVLLLPFLGFFRLYLCRRCRHTGCPSNAVGS